MFCILLHYWILYTGEDR